MPFDNQPAADPTVTALGQMIVESVNREANLRAQLIAAQAHIDARTNELTEALGRIKDLQSAATPAVAADAAT